MSSIDIKNFVDINIVSKSTASVNSTRKVTVLFTNVEGSKDEIFSNLASVKEKYAENTETYKYAKKYFDNGGVQLRIIDKTSPSYEDIQKLNTEEIVIAIVSSNANVNTVKILADNYNSKENSYGVNQKIFLASASEVTDLSSTDNLAVKIGSVGDEMAIAAYLSKIDFYGTNTVQDYAYTKETLEVGTNDNSVVEKAIKKSNVAIEIAGAIRNVGGNLTNGQDLVNQFALIVLHQTLSQRILDTLTQKLKGNASISALHNTISQELNKYVTNGYLTTDKCWTKPDLTIEHNGKTYTLIPQGTALNKGYRTTILPLSSLTDDEKENHKAPLIYIVLADGYAIRTVEIRGEVI